MNKIEVGENKQVFNPNSMTFEERKKDLEMQEKHEIEQKKREKQSPYSNWFQFNREYSREIIWLAGKYPKAQQVLFFLLDQMDNYNAVMCSYQVIQESLGMGRTSASNAIKILKEYNFITVYKSGTSNVYSINKNLAWSSWGNNFKYAKFDAKILISESEQEEIKIQTEKIKQITIKEDS